MPREASNLCKQLRSRSKIQAHVCLNSQSVPYPATHTTIPVLIQSRGFPWLIGGLCLCTVAENGACDWQDAVLEHPWSRGHGSAEVPPPASSDLFWPSPGSADEVSRDVAGPPPQKSHQTSPPTLLSLQLTIELCQWTPLKEVFPKN